MGDFEVGISVSAESLLGYHPCNIGVLTSSRNPVMGQCQAGSLTGAVASQSVTEARARSAQNGRQPFAERKSVSGLDCEADAPSRCESRF